jgi:putative transposase
LRLLTDAFGKTELKLGKLISKLPPILHDGKWILNIPYSSAFLRQPIATQPTAICGVDPGARTFLTVFDETNHEAYKLGDEPERCILKPLIDEAKRLSEESMRAAAHVPCVELGKRRRRNYELERDNKLLATQKIWYRVRDKVSGIHNAIVRHFAETYAYVAIGNLSHGVVNRADKGIPKKNSEADVQMWRLCDFKTKLLHRFSGLDDQEVVVQDEWFTSKTCGLCNNVKHNLGAAKRYRCSKCGYDVDRDVNGAINILRRSLGLWEPE